MAGFELPLRSCHVETENFSLFINRFTSNLRENSLFYVENKKPAIRIQEEGCRKYDDVGLKPSSFLSTNKQYLNMHRHESNCKYDITMMIWCGGRDVRHLPKKERKKT